MAHLSKRGVTCTFADSAGNPNLPQARSVLAAAFLSTSFEKTLLVDDDMGWDAADVERLLLSDKPVIGGVGARKLDLTDADPNKWCCRCLPGARPDDRGDLEVEAVGCAFLMISRSVFETLISAHPEWKLDGHANMPAEAQRHYYRFFRFPVDKDEVGEDYEFCYQWRALGGRVWIDPAIKLIHVGEYEYTGDIRKALPA
jgi:hypothetical protein